MTDSTDDAWARQVRDEYDRSAEVYNGYSLLPSGRLESQLIMAALGDRSGLSVLDLGGGNGLHARQAVRLGAASVDVVDISPQMLKVGREIEDGERGSRGGGDTIARFLEADVSRPLSHLPLREGGYDVVMANWIFSFAGTTEVLDAMFSNITTHLKPGGRFVGVRDAGPWSPALRSGKYGGSCRWVEAFPGGVRYLCVLNSEPPIEFEGVCLETIYSGSMDAYERHGLTGLQIQSYESAEIIQSDPEFWQLFLEHPNLAVVKGYKKVDSTQEGEKP